MQLAHSRESQYVNQGYKIGFNSKKENLGNEGIQNEINEENFDKLNLLSQEKNLMDKRQDICVSFEGRRECKEVHGVGQGQLLAVFQDYYSLFFQWVDQHFLAETLH